MASEQRAPMLCPNCRQLVSPQAARCLNCGMANPGAWWKNNAVLRALQNSDGLMRIIIGLNIGMYIISLLLNLNALQTPSSSPFTFLSPDSRSLLLLGATGTIPIDHLQRWWTLVSASFLHGGIFHLAFNMVALYQLIPFIAREYGTSRMLVIYTLTGIIGFAVSYWAGIRFTIGASASLCGLIGAALYFGKSRGGEYGTAIYQQIGGWAIGIFIFGFLISGINNWAHGGGMLAGALCGFWLGYHERRREQLWHRLLACACVGLTVVILAWALGTTLLYRAPV